jgi:ABC-2 type transport system ATP-binding protein
MKSDIPLEVKNLNFFYSNGIGIHNASFRVRKNETICLFGRNGSGKSTLLRILSTLQKPTSGKFFIFGIDGVKKKQQVREFIFPVFDVNAHFGFASGSDNLKFFSQLYGALDYHKYNSLIDDYNLNLDQITEEFSLGMKRKLYLLESICLHREILLLDEPSLGLDSETRDKFFNWINTEKPDDVSVVFGTNRIEEAKYAERILYIENGAIKEISAFDELFDSLLKIQIQTNDQDIVDYIENINELPNLIKNYLSFGTPKKIEIIGNREENLWTKEALDKIERAPVFVRKMIYKIVEDYAKDKGYSKITSSVVDEARGRFERR